MRSMAARTRIMLPRRARAAVVRSRLLVAAAIATAGFLCAVLASQAVSLASNYFVGTLAGGTAYNSIVRTWYGNQIYNADSQNIGAARLWSYRDGVGYLYDQTVFLPAGSVFAACIYGDCRDSPNTRDWCSSSNTRAGSCAGLYR